MTTETYNNPLHCPYKWKTGWPKGVFIGCNGNEVPSKIGGKWYIYVWIPVSRSHEYYCFEDDLFYSDSHFEKNIRNF